MAKEFASAGDLEAKKITFEEIGRDLYAFTAEGDPNSGVIIGDDGVLVIDAQATPAAAQNVIDCIRGVTDKPIKYVVLSHYHAVRVLGASGFQAQEIIASDACRAMIQERGAGRLAVRVRTYAASVQGSRHDSRTDMAHS